MKNFRFKKLVMTLALSFLFVFCSIFPVVENTIPIYASVRLNTKKLTLEEGEKYTLKIKGSSKAFKWTTSDKSVAKVKRSSKYKNRGIVTAVSEGTAVIVATGGNKSYTCTVKVVSENNSGKNTATPTPTPTNKPSAGSAVDTFSVTDNGVMIKSNLTGNEIYSKSGYSVGYVRKYSKSGSSYDQYAYEDKSFKSEFETGDSYVINYFQGEDYNYSSAIVRIEKDFKYNTLYETGDLNFDSYIAIRDDEYYKDESSKYLSTRTAPEGRIIKAGIIGLKNNSDVYYYFVIKFYADDGSEVVIEGIINYNDGKTTTTTTPTPTLQPTSVPTPTPTATPTAAPTATPTATPVQNSSNGEYSYINSNGEKLVVKPGYTYVSCLSSLKGSGSREEKIKIPTIFGYTSDTFDMGAEITDQNGFISLGFSCKKSVDTGFVKTYIQDLSQYGFTLEKTLVVNDKQVAYFLNYNGSITHGAGEFLGTIYDLEITSYKPIGETYVFFTYPKEVSFDLSDSKANYNAVKVSTDCRIGEKRTTFKVKGWSSNAGDYIDISFDPASYEKGSTITKAEFLAQKGAGTSALCYVLMNASAISDYYVALESIDDIEVNIIENNDACIAFSYKIRVMGGSTEYILEGICAEDLENASIVSTSVTEPSQLYSGNEKCMSCNGTGKKKCSLCMGKGLTKCHNCNAGRIQCSLCRGTGRVKNTYGEGTGTCYGRRGSGYETCRKCSLGWLQCSSCHGSGYKDCIMCNGKGKK